MAHHITVYGSSWCSDCKRAKRFLGDQQVEYKWVDVEQDDAGRAFFEKVNDGKDIIPTILFEDGSVPVEPSNAQLARRAGRAEVETSNGAETLRPAAVFVFIGLTPNTEFLEGTLALAVRRYLEEIGEARHVEVEMLA